MHIAVLNNSKLVNDADVSWMVRACNEQAREFARDWELSTWPVLFYKQIEDLPNADEVRPIVITDDANSFLGYHSYLAGADYIYGRVFAKVIFENGGRVLGGSDINVSDVLSHEVVEMRGNPYVIDFAEGPPRPEGRWYAREAGDPVQRDIIVKTVRTLWGAAKDVSLSNYVLPSWFSIKGSPPFDRQARLTTPFSMSPGGYMILKDDTGSRNNVFAAQRPPVWLMEMKDQLGARTKQIGKNV